VLTVVGVGIAVIVSGRDSESEDALFEDVLVIVEELETATEDMVDELEGPTAEFGVAYSDSMISDEEFQAAAAQWLEDSSRIINDYDVRSTAVRARLTSLRLRDEGLRKVREDARAHFGAWDELGDVYVAAIRSWIYDPSTPDDVYEHLQNESEQIFSEISRSFEALCSTLGDEQPSSLAFQERIEDLCSE
jgi:hypothetical protein